VAEYRDSLPQLEDGPYLTDGGLETTLIFHGGMDLPCFAAFPLLESEEGAATLREYFTTYAGLARRLGTGMILESPTWRASASWGERLGYDKGALAEANRKAIQLLEDVRTEHANGRPVVVSGCMGPRGDGYSADLAMTEEEAEAYHQPQLTVLADTTVDMACALTMNYAEEGVGLARAARRANLPVAISFTVETDGQLPSGQALKDAIEQVDESTAYYPSYYMINCAHPTHFASTLSGEGPWLERIGGVRANASSKSHAELDDATELDAGDPAMLAQEYAELKRRLPRMSVLGGCCGTDHRHVEQIATACLPLF
jgi:S-methylmethionine-dependent homocysteine/selenocysteine methylase